MNIAFNNSHFSDYQLGGLTIFSVNIPFNRTFQIKISTEIEIAMNFCCRR